MPLCNRVNGRDFVCTAGTVTDALVLCCAVPEKECGTHLLGSYLGREEVCGPSFLSGYSLLFVNICFIYCLWGGGMYAHVMRVFHGCQKRVTDPSKPEL